MTIRHRFFIDPGSFVACTGVGTASRPVRRKIGSIVTNPALSRRTLILSSIAATVGAAVPAAAASATAIHIVKDPDCGCCNEWAKILVSEGFIYDPQLREFKKVLSAARRAIIPARSADAAGKTDPHQGLAA